MASRPALPRRILQSTLEGVELAGADLSGRTLRGLDLSGRDLQSANLSEALLEELVLQGALMGGCVLRETELRQVSLRGAELRDSSWSRSRGQDVELAGADLSGAELRLCFLTRVDLQGASLEGADLREAQLEEVQAAESSWPGARLERAILDGAVLRKANLQGAQLAGANLERADLREADLRGADLSQARLDGAQLQGALLEGVVLEGSCLHRADLTGAQGQPARAGGMRGRDLAGLSEELEGFLLGEGASLGPGWLSTLRSRLLSFTQPAPPAEPSEASVPSEPPSTLKTETLDDPSRGDAEASAGREEGSAPVSSLDADGDPASTEGAAALGSESRESSLSRPEGPADSPGEGLVSPEGPLEGSREGSSETVPPGDPPADTDGVGAQAGEPRPEQPSEELLHPPETSPGLSAPLELEVLTPAAGQPPLSLRAEDSEEADEEAPDTIPAAAEEDTRPEPLTPRPPATDPGSPDALSPEEDEGGLRGKLQRWLGGRGEGVSPELLQPGAQLEGADLRRQSLDGLDLSGINLRNAQLQGASLRGAILRGAQLDGADLRRAQLEGCDLEAASLHRARLDDASLRGARLHRLEARGASFLGVDFTDCSLEGCDLSEADLSAARLCDLDLADSRLDRALLEQADLAGAQLERCSVKGTEFQGALGLNRETLEALSERGASVPRLFFQQGWMPRAVVIMGTLLLGGYLITQFLPESNLSEDDLHGRAMRNAEEGEIETAIARYEGLIERAEIEEDRISYRFELAALFSRLDRYEEASTQLQAAEEEAAGIEGSDLGPEAKLLQAELLSRQDRLEEEVSAYEQLAREDPPPWILARALVGLSKGYAEMGFADKALELQADILSNYPHNPEVVLEVRSAMAEILSAEGRYEESLETLSSLEGFPLDEGQRARWMVARAGVLEAMGRSEESLEVFQALMQRYPSLPSLDGKVLLTIAGLYMQEGDQARAQQLLDQLRASEPPLSILARVDLLEARSLEDQGAWAPARDAYQQILETYPQQLDITDTARSSLIRVVLADNPQDPLLQSILESEDQSLAAQVRLGQSQLHAESGRVELAIEQLESLLADYEDSPDVQREARMMLANLLTEEGEFGEASRIYRALREGAEDEESRQALELAHADVLRLAGRLTEAQSAYSALMTEGSGVALRASLGLANLAEARGEITQARRSYRELSLSAEDPSLRSMALEALANSYLDEGRDEEAMQAYRRYLMDLPIGHEQWGPTQLSMAGILQRRGELARAMKVYEEILSRSPDPVLRQSVQLLMGELLEQRGDIQEALELYSSLLEAELEDNVRGDITLGAVRCLLTLERSEEALSLAEATRDAMGEEEALDALTLLQAQALRSLGREQEALALGVTLEDAAGGAEDAAFQEKMSQAAELTEQGRAEEAVALYLQLIETMEDRPSQGALYNSIAQTLASAGQHEEARERFESNLSRFAEQGEVRFMAGMGLADLDRLEGELEEAVRRLESLTAPDRGSEAWRQEQLAAVLLQQGKEDEAEALYKQMLTEYQEEPGLLAQAQLGLAHLLRARDEILAARDLYDRAAKNSSDRWLTQWATLQSAQTLVDEGELDEAFFALRSFSGETEDLELKLQASLGMASIYLEKQKPKKALEVLEELQVSSLGPDWVASLTQQRVAAWNELGDWEEALAAWSEVLERYPENDDSASQARIGMGHTSLMSGDGPAAQVLFSTVLSESGDRFYQGQALLGLAQAQEGAGDREDAIASHQRLLEEYSDLSELASFSSDELRRLQGD